MKTITKILAVLLCVALLSPAVLAAELTSVDQMIADTAAGLSAMGGEAGTLLKGSGLFPAGTSGCDWSAIALALAGSEEYYGAYLDALRNNVEEKYAQNGCLDSRKATEYHRIALTVLTLGGVPTAFGKKPDGMEIDLIADGIYNYAGDSLGGQGLNGWIWALIALDASGAAVPEDARYQREDIISAILAAQEPDGGFGLIPGSSDIDITAMALQALAPYREAHGAQIDAALAYLSEKQSDSGGYVSYGAENAESTAQVILALCALGIDPETDARFIRDGHTLPNRLAQFRCEDGTFAHLLTDENGDYLASAQSLLALIAVQRLRNGQEWVLHFEHYAGPNQKTNSKSTITIYVVIGITALAVCGAGIAVIAGKRKQHG